MTGPNKGSGRAEVHGVDDRLAIDAAGDGLAELLARHPGRPAPTEPRRAQVEGEEVGVERDAHLDHAQPPLVGQPLEGRVVLRADVAVAHQIALGGFEAQRLGVLVGHDDERQAIEIRQLHAGSVAPEVAWVAGKDQPLPGDVLDQLKGTEADDVGDRLRGAPRALKLTGIQQGLERVPGKDGRLSSSRRPAG